jgi:dCMP deaminase
MDIRDNDLAIIKNINLINCCKNIDKRPNWDEYFLLIAYVVSTRSSCDRLHVGCVIVQDNKILSTGYNGHIKGAEHKSVVVDGHEQMTIHSEINAIANLDIKENKNVTAYVTHFPCINCAKALIAIGINKIVYAEDYKNNDLCYELYKMSNVEIFKKDF